MIREQSWTFSEQPRSIHYRGTRFLDLVISLAGIAFLWPVMIIIGVAILIESGRPIFFAQPRLGQHGRIFYMLKFRKFHKECSSRGLQLTLAGDQRLTRLGQFLNSWKLDELPQLFNVLAGHMSIVGPRPEVLAFADCFAGGFEAVLQYKPGLVGPSQAAFRSESEFFPREENAIDFYRNVLFPLKALIDLKYYSNRSLFSDIVWVGVTILTIFDCVPPIVPFQKFRKRSGRSNISPPDEGTEEESTHSSEDGVTLVRSLNPRPNDGVGPNSQ